MGAVLALFEAIFGGYHWYLTVGVQLLLQHPAGTEERYRGRLERPEVPLADAVLLRALLVDARARGRLLERVGRNGGDAVVLNTSLNVKGEPIACTPNDALRCFFSSGIDALAIQGFWVEKSESSSPGTPRSQP